MTAALDKTERYLKKMNPLEKLYFRAYREGKDLACLPKEERESYGRQFLRDCESFEEKLPELWLASVPDCVWDEISDDAFQQGKTPVYDLKNKFNPRHMLHEDYCLTNEKPLSIIKHCRYSKAEMHDHEFIEICYVLSGTCHHDFLLTRGAGLDMKEGETLIIPPGLMHRIAVYDQSVIINILVSYRIFQRVFFENFPAQNLLYRFFEQMIFQKKARNYLVFREGEKERMKHYFLNLVFEYMNRTPYSQEICTHLLDVFFLKLAEAVEEPMLYGQYSARISKLMPVMRFVQKEYQTVTLEELSEKFHYSKTYLNRMFKECTGTTVGQYIKDLKLQKGKELLKNGALSVDEIAEKIGYEDSAYFIRIFKKNFGITPLQYRKHG